MKKNLLLIFYIILVQATLASAQKFTATASHTEISVDEVFEVEWSLDAAGESFDPPSLSNFQVLSGPNQSTGIQFINGKLSRSLSYSYHLRPLHAGTFTIVPAKIKVGNKIIASNKLTINVTDAGGSSRNNTDRGKEESTGEKNGEVFIKVSTDKKEIYIGEPVTVTYKLYQYNAAIQQYAPRKAPSLSGFWVKDLPNETDQTFHDEMVNGKRYQVAVVKKAIVFPQRSGTLTADPMEAEVLVAMRSDGGRRSNNPWFNDPFFDDFFSRTETFRRTLKSNTINIKVNPLPEENKPANFSGQTGNYRINATTDKTKTRENEPVTYKITIEGMGNISQLQPFTLNLPPDWDVYDPKVTEKATGNISGSKTFEYTIIPKKQGNYTIPAVDFSFFDFVSSEYKKMQTRPIDIFVEKGTGLSAYTGTPYDKEDVKLLGQDIRYIKTSSEGFSKTGSSFLGSALFWTLLGLPFALFAGLLIFIKQKQAVNPDIIGSRKRKATSVAQKRLKAAQQLMQKGDKQAFYTEILNALYGYIHDKIGMQLAETSRDNIKLVFAQHKVDEESTQQFLNIVEQCEFAKYAPSAASGQNQEAIYNSSVELITKLEEQVK